MSTQQDKTIQPHTRGLGRPRLHPHSDLQLTVRFRYHCDQDLILALQHTPNKNQLLRTALRHWILEQEHVSE